MLEDWKAKGKKYGIIAGRFQPFNEGHADLVRAVLQAGLIPLITLTETCGDERNPFSVEQRIKMIRAVFPEIPESHIFTHQPTQRGAGDERASIDSHHKPFLDKADECVIFYRRKTEDLRDLILDGATYPHSHYIDFRTKPLGLFDCQQVTQEMFAERQSSTRIREDIGAEYTELHPAARRIYITEQAEATLSGRPVGGDKTGDKPIIDANVAPLGESRGAYQLRVLREKGANAAIVVDKHLCGEPVSEPEPRKR